MAFTDSKYFEEFETSVDMTQFNPLDETLESYLNKFGWTMGEYADIMQEAQDALIVLEKMNLGLPSDRKRMCKHFERRWKSVTKRNLTKEEKQAEKYKMLVEKYGKGKKKNGDIQQQ